jgi:hypothetical protein
MPGHAVNLLEVSKPSMPRSARQIVVVVDGIEALGVNVILGD